VLTQIIIYLIRILLNHVQVDQVEFSWKTVLSSSILFSDQMTFVWLPCLICVHNCRAVYNTAFYKYQFRLYSLKFSETFGE